MINHTTEKIKNGSSTKRSKSSVDAASEGSITRRSFLHTSLAVGAGTVAFGLSANAKEDHGGPLTPQDAAILRFLAAAEILETDAWQQYNELGGIPDAEVPSGHGNEAYSDALEVIEDEMQDYIHDNTDD